MVGPGVVQEILSRLEVFLAVESSTTVDQKATYVTLLTPLRGLLRFADGFFTLVDVVRLPFPLYSEEIDAL